MSCPKRTWSRNLILFFAFVLPLTDCGVKGDPLPPETPAELGRGRPTYRRATEGLKIGHVRKAAPSNTNKKTLDGQEGRDDDNE